MKVYGLSIRDTTNVGGVQLIVMEGNTPIDCEYVMEFSYRGIYRHVYLNSHVGFIMDRGSTCTLTFNEGR